MDLGDLVAGHTARNDVEKYSMGDGLSLRLQVFVARPFCRPCSEVEAASCHHKATVENRRPQDISRIPRTGSGQDSSPDRLPVEYIRYVCVRVLPDLSMRLWLHFPRST